MSSDRRPGDNHSVPGDKSCDGGMRELPASDVPRLPEQRKLVVAVASLEAHQSFESLDGTQSDEEDYAKRASRCWTQTLPLPSSLPSLFARGSPHRTRLCPCAPHRALRRAADVELPALSMPPKEPTLLVDALAAMPIDELTTSTEVYTYELAWVAFNWRVLSMAILSGVPAIERLEFLAITSSNLDGFFAKRVGGLMKQQAAGLENMKREVRQTPTEQLTKISAAVKSMCHWHAWALRTIVLPELERAGILLLQPRDLSPRGVAYLRDFYVQQVDPLLTPIKCAPLASGTPAFVL